MLGFSVIVVCIVNNLGKFIGKSDFWWNFVS